MGADVFKDGHDLLAARICYRPPGETEWRYAPLSYDFDGDRWSGSFLLHRIGRWAYTIEAWTDVFGTWRSGLDKKHAAGVDVASELLEGAALLRGEEAHDGPVTRRAGEKMTGAPDGGTATTLHGLTRYDRELEVIVDRERAGFAAWYEMFPRSQGTEPGKHATFKDAERRLEDIAALGFDVVYLPPIHPIGRTHRKGANNSLVSGPDDPGSSWAIGNELGGHTAVEPLSGRSPTSSISSRAPASSAWKSRSTTLQCSPDHPWVKEHPEWFFIRPDGSIKYAENPPKKYEDIYPINFWCDDFDALWTACRDVLEFWIARGVRIFRVDNPHTKPLTFWEWIIGEVQRAHHPDVILMVVGMNGRLG